MKSAPGPEPRASLWERIGQCYPAALEAAPLLLLALTIYLVASSYAGLPAEIPTHFDLRGHADDWGGKGSIAILPSLSLALYLLMTAVSAAIILAKDAKSLINLPARDKAAISQARAEELRRFLARSLLVMKTLLAGLMAYGVWMTMEVARGQADGLGPWSLVLLASLLVCTAVMAWRSLTLVLSRQG